VSTGGSASTRRPLTDDLDQVFDPADEDLQRLADQRLFVTGGTGFVGTWLLEVLVAHSRRAGTGPEIEVLTRDPEAFRRRAPHLAGAGCVHLTVGDVRDAINPAATPDLVIHAATPASAALDANDPDTMFAIVVEGTERVLDLAVAAGARMLFTSSGAVYGRQPPDRYGLSEDDLLAVDALEGRGAYARGKYLAEEACRSSDVDVVVARLFAFVGPHLPLDAHFAIGNFIRDALDGGPVVVGGDGTPFRSYQYAADLVVWLVALLVRGESGRAYNVGSDEAVDIATLARTVAAEVGNVAVQVNGTADSSRPAERYVPDCSRARTELGLTNSVSLEEAIRRTAAWHRVQDR